MANKITEESFLKDVATHEMKILREDGVNRHVRFKKPGTFNMQFDLITWPGHLCYTGDMGTYVFRRLEDMFEFFRTDRRDGDGLYINRGYWAEKVLAEDKHGKVKEFSIEKFTTLVSEMLDGFIEEHVPDATEAEALRQRVAYEVISPADSDGPQAGYLAARDFEHDDMTVFDTMELDASDYTIRYTWCCLALAWGIKQYDAAKAAQAATA